jgi:hypothetical protein
LRGGLHKAGGDALFITEAHTLASGLLPRRGGGKPLARVAKLEVRKGVAWRVKQLKVAARRGCLFKVVSFIRV